MGILLLIQFLFTLIFFTIIVLKQPVQLLFLLISQTELKLSRFVDIKDDEDFCEKLATEENLVLLPGNNKNPTTDDQCLMI